jgi:hypothetical protein
VGCWLFVVREVQEKCKTLMCALQADLLFKRQQDMRVMEHTDLRLRRIIFKSGFRLWGLGFGL